MDKRKEYLKKWRQENKDKCRLYSANHRKKYPNKVKERIKIWKDNHKGYISKYNKKYKEENKEVIREQTRESNRKRQKELQEKYNLQRNARLKAGRHIKLDGKCEMCGERDAEVRHHEDYTKPLDVQLICNQCHYQIHNGEQIGARG